MCNQWSSHFWYHLGRAQWQIGVQFCSEISVGRFETFLTFTPDRTSFKKLIFPERWTIFDALHQTSLFFYLTVAGGVVQIRDWTQETPVPRGRKGDLARKQRRSQALWKTSLCWFNLHHPDGCPVSVEKCPFAHSEDELKERPTAEYLSSL